MRKKLKNTQIQELEAIFDLMDLFRFRDKPDELISFMNYVVATQYLGWIVLKDEPHKPWVDPSGKRIEVNGSTVVFLEAVPVTLPDGYEPFDPAFNLSLNKFCDWRGYVRSKLRSQSS